MPSLNASSGTIFILQILTSAFLAVLFLQSGIDKIVDRRGNLEFLQGHFAKSPLAGTVPLLVTVITVLEIAAGALSAIGCVLIILTRDPTVAFYGAVISAISIVALFEHIVLVYEAHQDSESVLDALLGHVLEQRTQGL